MTEDDRWQDDSIDIDLDDLEDAPIEIDFDDAPEGQPATPSNEPTRYDAASGQPIVTPQRGRPGGVK